MPGEGIAMGQIDVGRQDGYALVSVVCKDAKTYQRIRAYLEPVHQSLAILEQMEPDAIHIMKKSEYSNMFGDYSTFSEEMEHLSDVPEVEEE